MQELADVQKQLEVIKTDISDVEVSVSVLSLSFAMLTSDLLSF